MEYTPLCPALKFEAMAVGLTLRAPLLVALAQFFVQDTKGQALTGLDTCFAAITNANELNVIEQKLSESLEDWQPSLTGIISFWAGQQLWHYPNEICWMCRDTFHCQLYFDRKPHFRTFTMEVYGRKIVQNFMINAMILGGKLALSYKAGGAKLGSDLAQLAMEYFGFPLATYTGKAVGLLGSTYAGALGGSENWGNAGVGLGALIGLGPWIYCEARLESFARLFFDEDYLKRDMKDFVTTK